MAEEIVKVLKIQSEDGERTVKSLKKEISDLRDALLNLDKSSEEYDKTLDKLIEDEKDLTSVMKAGKAEVKAAEGSYNALQQEMTALRKVWKETADTAKRNEIGARINEINSTLKDMDATIGNNQRKVGSYEEALQTLNATFANQKQELAALKTAMDNLDPSSEAYNQAFQRAAEITHNLSERQEALKYSSADVGDQLSNIRGIASNMAAGFSAVNAAMGLFGSKNEDIAKALLKVQQAMAVVQGLQGMDGLIKRTKGLSDAIKTWTNSTKAQTVALEAQTVATNTTTVAQKGLNAAMKANPVGAILTAITALVALLGPLSKLFDTITGKTKKMQKSVDDTTAAMKAFDDSIAKLDEKHRLEQIEARLKGISEAQMRVLKGQQYEEDFSNAYKNLDEALKLVYQDFDDMDKVVDVNIATLQEWGFTEEQIKALTENTNNIVDESAKAHEKANRKVIKHNDALKSHMEWLAKAAIEIEKYKEAVKTLADEEDNAAIEEADRARQIAKNADEALKSEKQKLTERYQEEKALMEKYHLDTTNLTKKYYKDLAALNAKGGKSVVKTTEDTYKQLEEQRKKWENAISSNSAGGGYVKFFLEYKETLNDIKEGYKVLAKEAKDANIADAFNQQASAIEERMKGIKDNFQAVIEDMEMLITTSSGNELGPILDKVFPDKGYGAILKDRSGDFVAEFYDNLTTEFMKQGGDINSLIVKIGSELQLARVTTAFRNILKTTESEMKGEIERLNDITVKLFENTLFPTVDKEIEKMQNDLDRQSLDIDFKINFGDGDLEKLEMEKIDMVYQSTTDQLAKQLEAYQAVKDFVEANGLIPSAEYDEAIKKIDELNTAIQKATDEQFYAKAEIRDKYFQQEITATEMHYENLLRGVENAFARENETGSWWEQLTPISPKRIREQMDEAYNIQIEGLEKQKQLWQDRLNDENITNEQRAEAKTALAQLEMDLADTVLEHDIQNDKLKAESFQQYVDGVRDSIQQLGSLYGAMGDYYEADIEAKVKAGEMSEEVAKEEYDRVKKMKRTEIILNTIAGAAGAFLSSMAEYGMPFGPIIGALGATTAVVTGKAQLKKLESTNPYDKGGSDMGVSSSSASASAPSTEIIPQYTANLTTQSDTDMLRNAVADGMSSTPLFVSVTDIDNTQNQVKVVNKESSF